MLALFLVLAGGGRPAQVGAFATPYYDEHYLRWSGSAISWSFNTPYSDSCMPSNSRAAVEEAANTWNVSTYSGAGYARLHFTKTSDGGSQNGIYTEYTPAAPYYAYVVTSYSGTQMTQASTYLNCAKISGYDNTRRIAAHEFGHWLKLRDTYEGETYYQPQHWGSLMGDVSVDANGNVGYIANGYPQWDERFGAIWLYGPHYTGWDNNWHGYWENYTVLVNGVSSRLAYKTTPENNVSVIWENQAPGHATDRYYRLSGTPDGGCGHCYAYMKIADTSLTIQSGMRLRWHQYFYWSNKISIDAHFTDGTWLRDYHLRDQNGYSIHPAERPGYAGGQWMWFDVDLSQNAGYGTVVGKTIDYLMIAYDWNGTASFLGYIDDVNIGF